MKPKVLVVTDWERCSRGVLWKEDLRDLSDDIREIRLADSLTSQTRGDPTSLFQALETYQVLILNFDCINGDPAFGSDVALDWFKHRHPELLQWIAGGGIMIVEGQAMLAVPTQSSYDALFGRRELRVSGPSVKPIPAVEMERTGAECQVTAEARTYKLFPGLNKLRCTSNRTIGDAFPGNSRLMIGSVNEICDWKMLYRGWFPRLPSFGRRFRWTPLIRTERKKYGFSHPTLLAAPHGAGIMFVSTMVLAGTGQQLVIRGLVNWNASDNQLPRFEEHKSEIPEKIISAVISAAAAAVSAFLIQKKIVLGGKWTIACYCDSMACLLGDYPDRAIRVECVDGVYRLVRMRGMQQSRALRTPPS